MATTPVFSQQEPMNSMIRKKYLTLEDEPARSEGVQCATGEEWKTITNSSRKNEVTGPKQKLQSVVDVSLGGNKVQHYN